MSRQEYSPQFVSPLDNIAAVKFKLNALYFEIRKHKFLLRIISKGD